jgi:hypothetical protein
LFGGILFVGIVLFVGIAPGADGTLFRDLTR